MSGLWGIFSEMCLPLSSWPIRWLAWCQTSSLPRTASKDREEMGRVPLPAVPTLIRKENVSRNSPANTLFYVQVTTGSQAPLHLLITWFSISSWLLLTSVYGLCLSAYIYITSLSTALSSSGLSRWLGCSPGPSMLWQGVGFPSFLRLTAVPLRKCN